MKAIERVYESTKGAAMVFPPGTFIVQELEERGWSRTYFAEKLGMSEKALDDIISGRSRMSTEITQKLASAFGTSPVLWSNLEKKYIGNDVFAEH